MPAHPTQTKANPALPAELAFAELELSTGAEILNYYGHLRDYVKHEDNLINFRLSWSLTIHAFLLTAYGLLLSKGVDILVGISKGDTSLTPGLKWTILLLLVAQVVIAVLGAIVGRTSYKAIKAANTAIENLDRIAHKGCLDTEKLEGCSNADEASRKSEKSSRQVVHLPRIIRGGTGELGTKSALDYYLLIPKIMLILWIVFGLGSLAAFAYSASTGEKAFEPFKPSRARGTLKPSAPASTLSTPPASSPHPLPAQAK